MWDICPRCFRWSFAPETILQKPQWLANDSNDSNDLIFPGSNGFVAWKAWNGCLGMIHNPLGAAWSRLRVVVASKTWKGSNRSVLESHAGQMGKLVMPRFTKRPSVGTWLCCAPEKKAVARENGRWSEVLSWVWQCPEGVLRSQGSSMFFQAYSIYYSQFTRSIRQIGIQSEVRNIWVCLNVFVSHA